MSEDLGRLLTYCPATDKKADQMLNQGNKLVGYIFKDGETYRTCAFGSVRNSISQKEWEGLTFPNQPSYEQLEKQNKALRGLVDRCKGMQWARSSGERSQIWDEVEQELKEIGGE